MKDDPFHEGPVITEVPQTVMDATANQLLDVHAICDQRDAAVKRADALERELARLHDPLVLHAHCVRYLTDAQVAHLFGDRMTVIANSRDAWRQCAEGLAAIVGVEKYAPVEEWATDAQIDAALAAFEKLKGEKP